VLRGTLPWDIKNWFTDINFIKKKYPHCDNNCEVHRGFYEAYEDIQDHVRASIDNYTATFKKRYLIVTGHSLGGALSTHAVAHLTALGYKVDYFYNMGSPRVGDERFHDWFTRKYGRFVARIVHWKDQVPHLPDEYWGFHHLHNEIFYNYDQSYYKVCADSGEDKTCSNQYLVTNWEDHMFYCGVNFYEAF
jgi:predicted lipase